MAGRQRPLAIVTGASTGIGYELAKCCANDGFDLVVAADELTIQKAAADFRVLGAKVDAVEADLATMEGVEKLYDALQGRTVDALIANAGRGLGEAFRGRTLTKFGMGQANVRRWVDDILPLLTDDDPLGVDDFATHHVPLSQAPEAYKIFQKKEDGAMKILFKP
jgi:NAD(P)-dependent dehydrogenase (short-subunit alcohol dehydrogenase family)